MSTIFCPHCGMTNRAGSNFCNHCGTALQEPVETPMTEPIEDDLVIVYPTKPDEQPTPTPHEQATDHAAQEESAQDTPDDRSKPAKDDLFALQPWLQSDETDADENREEPQSVDEDGLTDEDRFLSFTDETITDVEGEEGKQDDSSSRMITGMQGLLDPVGLSREASSDESVNPDEAPSVDTDSLSQDASFAESQRFLEAELFNRPPSASLHTTPQTEIDDQQLRQIRRLMAEEPMLKEAHLQTGPPTYPSLRMPWIFWLIGLSLGLPVLWGLNFPSGLPLEWPGVADAYHQVQALPEGAPVVLFWAYDPTTAGELDRVAFPVMRHLLDRQSQLIVVSLLPNGPATAQRLLNRVVKDAYSKEEQIPSANQPTIINGGFLPGGTAALPLVGQNLVEALSTKRDTLQASLPPNGHPALAIVLAHQAEDVQHWLEQVQPINRVPVVALVGAGADPILRPYLDSGQLGGLVSGFDGANAYMARMTQPISQTERQRLQSQIVSLNWGLAVLLLIILFGNLTTFIDQRNEKRKGQRG